MPSVADVSQIVQVPTTYHLPFCFWLSCTLPGTRGIAHCERRSMALGLARTFGGVWYKSRQLKKTICCPSDGWWAQLRVFGFPSADAHVSLPLSLSPPLSRRCRQRARSGGGWPGWLGSTLLRSTRGPRSFPSSQFPTYKTVKPRFWLWLEGKSPSIVRSCSRFARKEWGGFGGFDRRCPRASPGAAGQSPQTY